MKSFGGVGRGPGNNLLDLVGSPARNPYPGIFFTDSLFEVVIHIDSQEINVKMLSGSLNSLSAFEFLLLLIFTVIGN